MITPYYFQRDAIAALYAYFAEKDGNPIVAMPTGTGKSVVIAVFVHGVLMQWPWQRIIILTHVKELIEQNYQRLLEVWPTAPAGIYSAGLNRRDVNAPITFAGIDSVTRRPSVFGHQDLAIIDECHLVSPENETRYQKFLTALRKVNPNLRTIGLSATPYRLKSGRLTDSGLFDDIAYDLTQREAFARLVAEGYIAKLVTKPTNVQLDVSGVHLQGGEFNQAELQLAVDRADVSHAALQQMLQYGHDRKHWLIFSSGITHAEHIATMLQNEGIAAACVHSKMPTKERTYNIEAFKTGVLQALVNNNVLTTGFDYKPIDLIGVLRPTVSTGLWVQMLGRGTRPHEAKDNCLVLDFAGNTPRLGPINDPVIPTGKRKAKPGTAPVKLCEMCGTYNHASVRYCTECGAEFPRFFRISPTAGTGEVMVQDEAPKVNVFEVDRVIYAPHRKKDKPTSLKATYYCGLRMFQRWVCLGHDGYAKHNAHEWWREHTSADAVIPETAEQALTLLHTLRTPTHIRVWVNKRNPEIMAYDFTGTGFNTLSRHIGGTGTARL